MPSVRSTGYNITLHYPLTVHEKLEKSTLTLGYSFKMLRSIVIAATSLEHRVSLTRTISGNDVRDRQLRCDAFIIKRTRRVSKNSQPTIFVKLTLAFIEPHS